MGKLLSQHHGIAILDFGMWQRAAASRSSRDMERLSFLPKWVPMEERLSLHQGMAPLRYGECSSPEETQQTSKKKLIMWMWKFIFKK